MKPNDAPYTQIAKAAIITTVKPGRQSRQSIISATIDSLEHLKAEHTNIEVTITWIPGHRDIEGNDKADAAAKYAVENPTTVTNTNPTPLKSSRNQSIKNMSKNEWESIWNASNSRQLRRITASRQGQEGKKIYCNLSKRKHVAYLSRLRTGHCNLRQYHHRFRHEEDPYCDCGDGSIENVEHYLLSCRKYDRQRDKLRRNVGFGQMWMEKLLGHPRLATHTLEFMEETKMMRIGYRNELQEL